MNKKSSLPPETRKTIVVTYQQTPSFEDKYGDKLPQVVQVIENILAFLTKEHDPADEIGLLAGRLKVSIAFFSAPNTNWFSGRNLIIGRRPSTEADGFEITLRYNGVLFKGSLKLEPVHLQFTQRIHGWMRKLSGNNHELKTAMKRRDNAPAHIPNNKPSEPKHSGARNAGGITPGGFPIIAQALRMAIPPSNGHTMEARRDAGVHTNAHSVNPHATPSIWMEISPRVTTPTRQPQLILPTRLTGSPASQEGASTIKLPEEKKGLKEPEFSDALLELFLTYVNEQGNEGKGWARCISASELNRLRDGFLAEYDKERFESTPREKRGVYLGRLFHVLGVKHLIHQSNRTGDWHLSDKGGKLIQATEWETLPFSEVKNPFGGPSKEKLLPVLPSTGSIHAAPEPAQTPDSIVDVLKAKLQKLVGQKDLNEKEIDRLTAQNESLGSQITDLEEKLKKAEASQATLRELEERMKREQESFATLMASLSGDQRA